MIVSQSQSNTSGTDSEIIDKLVSILKQNSHLVDNDQRDDIVAAVAAANEGDGKEAKSLLSKVCGPAWEFIQTVGWPIIGELVKKSLNL